MARPELGIKRQCQNCGAKFYDLNHDPAVCPKCGTAQQVVAVVAAGRSRAAPSRVEAEAKVRPHPEDALVVAEGVEGAEDIAEDAEETAEDEIEAETEGGDGDEDVFLEEDEEDEGGVSGLIDGDIEDEET